MHKLEQHTTIALKNSDDNEYIANKLIELTQAHRNWGFKLCFLHIRNVLGRGLIINDISNIL